MLKGITVLEFQGLAPTVFCGMYFADQGAQVVLVARKDPAPFSMQINKNLMNRGKKCITLSPKVSKQRQIIEKLIKISDIIIDPYRPGVLEKLNLGPQFIFKVNKKAVLLRVSGYGQQGPMSQKPGHDLNYISTSGIVPLINQKNDNKVYEFPTNYLADFVSCSLGITAALSALAISKISGIGRVVDCSMTDGCRYYTKIITRSLNQHPQKSQKEPKFQFISENNQQYCIQSNQFNNQRTNKLITELKKSKSSYYQDKQCKISRINEVGDMQTQVKQLSNPYNNNFNGKQKSLPNRGQHSQQIQQLLKKVEIQKSKL